MASLNRVLIMGNLGKDPELRHTPTQQPVCTLRVATTDVRTDAAGNKQELTEWHNVVVWGKQAENCQKYLTKGRSVLVEGRIQTRSWDDKTTGQKRYATDVVANLVQFIGSASQRDDMTARYDTDSAPPPSEPPYSYSTKRTSTEFPPTSVPVDNFSTTANNGNDPLLSEIPF